MFDFNVREESFGATVLNLKNGQRDYINNEELESLLKFHKLPKDLSLDKDEITIKFTKTIDKNASYFSFADICYLELTRACNLHCVHCLNNSGQKLQNQLAFYELQKLVEHLSSGGIQEIRFTGGEPLVYEHIYELIKLATDNGIYTSIGTNGTLITENVARLLKQAGLKKAVVSVDGTLQKHDEIRGKGNFEKTISGINNLEKYGIETRINSVIMKSNIDDIIKLAKQLNSQKKHLMIRRFIESGRGENLKDNVLTKEDYEYVKFQLRDELNADTYINGHYLREKTERISDRIDIPFDISDGCKAGKRALIITPEGNIHLCGFLAAQNFSSIGNVRNIANFISFWNRTQKKDCLFELRKKLEDYNKLPNIQPTNCLAYVKNYMNRGKL